MPVAGPNQPAQTRACTQGGGEHRPDPILQLARTAGVAPEQPRGIVQGVARTVAPAKDHDGESALTKDGYRRRHWKGCDSSGRALTAGGRGRRIRGPPTTRI